MTSKEALLHLQTLDLDAMENEANNWGWYYDNKPKAKLVREDIACIQKDLEILEIFKKHLKFKISDKPANDGSYIIFIDDFDDDYDYMCFAISKEEKDLLKEWLENDNKQNN